MPQISIYNAIRIISVMMLFFFGLNTKASADGLVLSYMTGTQVLPEKTVVEDTDAEQNRQTGLLGFDIGRKSGFNSGGITITRFHNNWRSVDTGDDIKGRYLLTTLTLHVNKYGRIYNRFYWYGGFGFGFSLFEDRYKTGEGEDKYEIIPLITYVGNAGLEWRNRSNVYFLEAQYFFPESLMKTSEYEFSAAYNYFGDIFVPRLMLGMRFSY